jgi:putative PIN family toxin of toxin-antitoxin system
MDIVLDTSVLVAGLRSHKGASHNILTRLPDSDFRILLFVPLLIEYEAVLKRPEHLSATGLDAVDIKIILDMIAANAKAVRLHYLWRPMLRDPSDDMVGELAVAGSAKILVTLNIRDFRSLTRSFGIPVLSPGEFIALSNEDKSR